MPGGSQVEAGIRGVGSRAIVAIRRARKNWKNKKIENDNEIQEYNFDQENFDLNKKLKYFEIECERIQRITTHFEK